MIRFMLDKTWVLATYYKDNNIYVISVLDWFGIGTTKFVLTESEFKEKTETIMERP